MTDHLTKLREMREVALAGGGPERVADQKAKGKGTARERLSFLLDEGSFQEIGALATHDCTDFGMAEKRFPGDGVVCGFGKINGRRVAVFAHDFTVLGGSFSAVQSQKICRLQDLALESGIPLIGLNDSGGARIQEGVRSLAAYGEVFTRNVLASGVIPQISVGARALRGRRGVLAGPHRLRDHGARHELDVHHRAGRHQGGDRRGRDRPRPRRQPRPQQPQRRRPAPGGLGGAGPRAREAAAELPAAEQHRGPAAAAAPRPARPDERLAEHGHPRRRVGALRHARGPRRRLRPRQLPRDPPLLRAQLHRGLRPARRLVAPGSWPTSRPTSRAPSTSTPRTRSRATCASATPSTSRW